MSKHSIKDAHDDQPAAHGSLHPPGVEEHSPSQFGGVPLIELCEASAGYADTPAFERVSLKIWPGQFMAVVGPNGGGKTTLLRTILKMVPLTQGEILMRGEKLRKPWRERVGYVPQLETIDWNFPITVEEVISMGFYPGHRWYRGRSLEQKQTLQSIMARLNLDGLGNRHIRELSGGQQQAVFLGRALLGNPKLILLDEPTAGLDIRSRDDVIHFLHEINHSGVAIVITAHDLNWVSAHLPWVVCLNRRLIAEGRPDEVFNANVLKETYRGEMVVFHHDGMVMIGERPHAPHN